MTLKGAVMPSGAATPNSATEPNFGAKIRHARLRRFYDYWHDKRGARQMPARRDIDPLEFAYMLGDLMMVDVLREPLRFRVRLHGTNLVMRANYDMTGKWLDELPRPEYRAYVLDRCRGLVASGEPMVTVHDRILDERVSRYEALWLPLADDGMLVDLLICALIYGEAAPTAAVPGA